MSDTRCNANGCKTFIESKYLMCAKHWYMVSSDLKNKIYLEFGKTNSSNRFKSIPYLTACAEAVEMVAEKEGIITTNSFRNIANKLTGNTNKTKFESIFKK